LKNENTNNTNPFTPCKNQRQKLTLSIPELIELDNTNQFKITFCCLLAEHIYNTNKLSELRKVLNAVAAYVIVEDRDFYYTKSAGFFELNNNKIFFKERHNSILIGLLSETEYISKFEQYQYYSLNAVVKLTVDALIESSDDF